MFRAIKITAIALSAAAIGAVVAAKVVARAADSTPPSDVIAPSSNCAVASDARHAFRLEAVPLRQAAKIVTSMTCKPIIIAPDIADVPISTDILERREPISGPDVERIFAACVEAKALKVTRTTNEMKIERRGYTIRPGSPPGSASAMDAQVEALKHAQTFVSTEVGALKVTSEESNLFRAVMRRPDARLKFEDMLRTGAPAGKLYGLCGIKLMTPRAFDAAVEPFLRDTGSVDTQVGCVGGHQRASDLAQAIRNGAYCEDLSQGRI
jgi:hypothetical protein